MHPAPGLELSSFLWLVLEQDTSVRPAEAANLQAVQIHTTGWRSAGQVITSRHSLRVGSRSGLYAEGCALFLAYGPKEFCCSARCCLIDVRSMNDFCRPTLAERYGIALPYCGSGNPFFLE